jgi:RNA polymerase sigma factor (TIGR02999 family)
MTANSAEITDLLKAGGTGDRTALDRLTPLIYDELRRNAKRYMRRERPGNTLQTTALVNETYLRLVDVEGVEWKDRVHFLAVAAQMMRRILVDAARARVTAKRGGQVRRLDSSAAHLDNMADVSSMRGDELMAVDGALTKLGQIDAGKAGVIELRFWRPQHRGNRRGPRNLSANRYARLATGEGLALARTRQSSVVSPISLWGSFASCCRLPNPLLEFGYLKLTVWGMLLRAGLNRSVPEKAPLWSLTCATWPRSRHVGQMTSRKANHILPSREHLRILRVVLERQGFWTMEPIQQTAD